MMTNMEVLYEGIKFGMTASASRGAKILIDEAVNQFTPDDLDNTKRICVEIAKWGAATAFGSVCAKSVSDKLEKGKSYVEAANKIIKSIKEGSKPADPVIEDSSDNKDDIVNIEESETVETIDIVDMP